MGGKGKLFPCSIAESKRVEAKRRESATEIQGKSGIF
jgi:hypothetical protein